MASLRASVVVVVAAFGGIGDRDLSLDSMVSSKYSDRKMESSGGR